MTQEVIQEVVITSIPAPAALKSEDQLTNSPDTVDGKSLPPELSKRKEKPVPHYLRASSRSCHDNCKYGTHHSPEPKKHWPVLRRQLRRSSTGNQQETGNVEIILPKRARPQSEQKMKNSHVKHGSDTAPVAKSEIVPCTGDLPAEASEPGNLSTHADCLVISHDDVADFGDGESSDGAESIELEMPLAIQDSDTSDEKVEDVILRSENPRKDGEKSRADPGSDQSAASSEVRNTPTVIAQAKRGQARPGSKSNSSVDDPTKKLKKKATLSVTRNTASILTSRRTSHTKAAVADSEISSEPKPTRARTNTSVTTAAAKFSRQKQISPTSNVQEVKETKVTLPSNVEDSSAKPARLAKTKVTTGEKTSSGKQTDRKMAGKNVAKNAQAIEKRKGKVTPRPLKLSRSLNMSAKSFSSLKVRTVKKGKIAPTIKNSSKVPGTEISAAAKEKLLKPASVKVRKAELNDKTSLPHKEKPDTATPRTRTPRVSKPAPIPSTMGTQQSPRKLTFRRGKVLNPDDGSSSTPTRRLRFRPAMPTATDASVRIRGGGGRVSGKGSGRSAAGARDTGTSRTEVVVLRRRQGGGVNGDRKRKEQVLLNNVIEETASRLVSEARKSKVKALVGAFETVISLQDGRKAGPPATVVQ